MSFTGTGWNPWYKLLSDIQDIQKIKFMGGFYNYSTNKAI